ncbi:MAG: DUF2027 domain-containing protein [Prevotellaceae bacterium]|nr:DUF2027 domain-containing protein [Prevotellaceae bacterium]MDY6130568.1 DUF2027 domain-containing protein [Prevotella sp.]
MKTGDKVRFLSESGGGIVAGFQGKNIVLVEDEDGFQIPVRLNEVVVVEEDNYDVSKMVEKKMAKAQSEKTEMGKHPVHDRVSATMEEEEDYDPSDKPVTFQRPAVERKGGDALSVYLAFVPIDLKEVTKTRFESYLVNDSNYYVRFAYMNMEGNSCHLISTGEIEPNTKLFVEEFGREHLNDMERLAVHLISYKRDKPFMMKEPVQVSLRVDAVKFYKLHTFRENDFFEQPAYVMTVVENDCPSRPLVVDARQMKESMYKGCGESNGQGRIGMPRSATSGQKGNTYVRRYNDGKSGNPFVNHSKDDIVVVDLHASEVLDTTAGMSHGDILNYQLDVFRRTLADYGGNKGQKIVFIHGKGEGVLRQAIIRELKSKFKNYPFQDASFQEYGYGATQVTVK